MRTTPYTEAELRALADQLDHPVAVTRASVYRIINAAYAEVVGYTAAELEGRAFSDFLAPEDQPRLNQENREIIARGHAGEGVQQALAVAKDGHRISFQCHVQLFPAAEGEPWLFVNCLILPARQRALERVEQLVDASAQLVAERTEENVRRAAVAALQRAGLWAGFFGLERDDQLTPLWPDGAPPLALDPGFAARALDVGRPTFGGSGTEITHVYVPVKNAAAEVLVIVGDFTADHTAALALFGKHVSTAFANARLIRDLERRNQEQHAVAEVARLAAGPELPSLDALLAPMAGPLEADAVLLHLPESESSPRLVLVASWGLDEATRARFAFHPVGRGPAGTSGPGEDGVLWSEGPDAALLREASGGKLCCGASIRLHPGGHRWGALSVLRARTVPFGGAALRLLGTLGDLLAATLEQGQLRRESTRQLSETQLLLELARTTAGTLEVQRVLDVACDFLVKLLDTSNCFILLHDAKARVLRGAASSSGHRTFFRQVELPVDGVGVAARTARERRPVVVEDVTRDSGHYTPLVERFGETALLGLPLEARGELIGVVVLDDTRGPRHFRAEQIDLALASVSQLALSVANARLYASLKDSYAELADTREQMVKQERLAALGELSAIVAHEVRNPLGVIFNAVSSLRRLLKPQGDASLLIDILGEESDRLNHLVGELLDFARPRELSLQPEDVGRLLHEVLEAAATEVATPGARWAVEAEVDPELPLVPVDRRLLRQALLNVAANALQAMPRGGTLRARAGVGEREGRREVRIDLTDEGSGIAPEISSRVFEPFFTTKAKGTGLGLAVVKRIVEDHRGAVELRSTPGRGTTFTFRLPLDADRR